MLITLKQWSVKHNINYLLANRMFRNKELKTAMKIKCRIFIDEAEEYSPKNYIDASKPNDNKEIWIKMVGFDLPYEISSYGRIRTPHINYKNFYRIKSPFIEPSQYVRIGLKKNQQYKNYSIHRLVCQYFIPNPNNYPVVNHKDGNKSNNIVDNLEWCTHEFNSKHAVSIGKIVGQKGENNPMSRFTNKQIIEIRKLYKAGVSMSRLAILTNTNTSHISNIVKYNSWNF